MLVVSCALSVVLTLTMVVLPLARNSQAKQHRRFLAQHRAFMLVTVKRYYPELAHLSYDEIESRYNVVEAYDRINWSVQ